ncbi:MAG: bi-domain-containing oxidoreductase [Steroidobacteraceae bacterium]
MRQVVQHLRTGSLELLELPLPRPDDRQILIRTRRTLLSAGTERMLLEFGRAGLIGKARQQPDRVRVLLDRLRTEGVAPVLEAALSKLDEPLPLGYANVGTVVEVGAAVRGFRAGERVVSNASHATWARVGENLCARVPESVDDEQAAFVVPSAIGLQGVRLAEPTIGEVFAVIGAGLIGLLTVQLLVAAGCKVLAIDVRADRLALAAGFGAATILAEAGVDIPACALELTAGRGVDGALITAATDSDAPVRDAARMTRQRGRVILVGVAGLHLARADFYAKELRLQVSCSYGPGRYDPAYEVSGQDYPLGFVRWTEQRNFEAVLELLAAGRLDVEPLISHRFAFEHAEKAYDALLEDPRALGIVLTYQDGDSEQPARPPATVPVVRSHAGAVPSTAMPRIAVIGVGGYARRFLLPALKDSGARLVTLVATGSPLSGWAARRAGFEQVSTDSDYAIASTDVDAVVIATRHDSHARFVCAALAADKEVFVEKPLALSETELSSIERAYADRIDRGKPPLLMVGFNRRFAPLALEMRRRIALAPGPRCFVYTVNAGAIPASHWTQDPGAGGGRIIGEACHFIDLLRFFASCAITTVSAAPLRSPVAGTPSDSASISLGFADGSIGTIHYFTNGGRTFPKERVEVFAGGATLRLDNFRSLVSFSWPGFRSRRSWRQDKGNRACVQAFVAAVRSGTAATIAFEELIEVSRASIAAAREVAGTNSHELAPRILS